MQSIAIKYWNHVNKQDENLHEVDNLSLNLKQKLDIKNKKTDLAVFFLR